ncbi:hypothetical protein WA026_001526 [Henosepilachna vigintioctopunctata]|uniref:Uncharacterized protein n=1 Tax=Henosepilachna vigintioctopunctata TaxID=420089 RepID=A0AAW1UU51_9CUCU
MFEAKLLLVSLLFLLLLHFGHTLTCYSCLASVGHGLPCENIANHTTDISQHECFYTNAVCAIYKIEYGTSINIYRSCKEAGVCLALSKKFNSQYNRVLDCKTCNDDDLCNSSHPNTSSIFLIIVSITIFLICNR